MADVDISLAPIGKIVRMFKMLYIPNKKDYCLKFVSQTDILVKSLESGKTDGMLLFHAFEKLVFDYTWDWIAGYYNITMATMLLEPLLEVSAETFSLPMRDKIYQLISSCLGPKVCKSLLLCWTIIFILQQSVGNIQHLPMASCILLLWI